MTKTPNYRWPLVDPQKSQRDGADQINQAIRSVDHDMATLAQRVRESTDQPGGGGNEKSRRIHTGARRDKGG